MDAALDGMMDGVIGETLAGVVPLECSGLECSGLANTTPPLVFAGDRLPEPVAPLLRFRFPPNDTTSLFGSTKARQQCWLWAVSTDFPSDQ